MKNCKRNQIRYHMSFPFSSIGVPSARARPRTPKACRTTATTSSLISTTPIHLKSSGHDKFMVLNVGLASETHGKHVGPMPPRNFINTFIPNPLIPFDTNGPNNFAEVSLSQTKKEMYPIFVCLNYALSVICMSTP